MIRIHSKERSALVALAVLSVAVGVAGYGAPMLGIGIAASSLLLALGTLYPASLTRVFLASVGVVLLGYAFFGRPFAHLGFAPVYIGEVVLGLGLLSAVLHYFRWSDFRLPIIPLILVFMLWGALRTIPYVDTYKSLALRDAAIWGYAGFAVLLAPLLIRSRLVGELPSRVARYLPYLLLFVPVIIVVNRIFRHSIPLLPGSSVSILGLRPGEASVHFAAAGAFLLLGLHRTLTPSGSAPIEKRERFWWAIWLAGFLVIGSVSRSGLLTMTAGLAVAACIRPLAGAVQVMRLGFVFVILVLSLFAYDVTLDLGEKREISVHQIMANFESISGSQERGELAGPREWRLEWWSKIVGYTFSGSHFAGKGFGINLADDDGFAVDTYGSLRSPHNGHLTILARAGVPGFAIWALLQLTFALALIRAYRRARRIGEERWSCVNIWILAYWAAFMVNASFDVFLEGPQGGIWFWCLMGFGIAALHLQRAQLEQQGSRLAVEERLA